MVHALVLLLASGATAAEPLRLEGRWVLGERGEPVAPRGFERGLQTSALVARADGLWSIGDQRAEWPGSLLHIDPRSARLAGAPLKLRASPLEGQSALFDEYRSIRNSDFEGLAAHPKDPRLLFGATEDKRQWVVAIRLDGKSPPGEAAIEAITPVEFPDGLKPFQDDLNYRIEGIALSDDGKTIYLAWERAADKLPRIFSITTAEGSSGKPVKAREVPVDFTRVPPRADKSRALLNLNDLQFLRHRGRALLLALARDQERILVIAVDEGKVERTVDLDLRAPGGEAILWVSPEGLAVDPAAGRLWIINDPDSIRGNYRGAKTETAEGRFAAMAPLLFEAELSSVLP